MIRAKQSIQKKKFSQYYSAKEQKNKYKKSRFQNKLNQQNKVNYQKNVLIIIKKRFWKYINYFSKKNLLTLFVERNKRLPKFQANDTILLKLGKKNIDTKENYDLFFILNIHKYNEKLVFNIILYHVRN